MRGEPEDDNGFAGDGAETTEPTEPTYPSGPTELVPPVDPYVDPADPFDVEFPTLEPAAAAPPWYASPAVIFGLVGTLLGLIALAVVTTTNCARLGLCAGDLGAVNLLPAAPLVRTIGRPDTAVRDAPGGDGPPTLRVRPGTVATAVCQRDGWARVTFPAGTADRLTGRSTEDERTGYVTLTDLESGADLPQRVPTCPGATPAPTPTATRPAFSAAAVHVDDCVANRGTAARPALQLVACADTGSYRVRRTATGVSIPEGPDGEFDATTAAAVCAGTDYDTWYGSNALDDTGDVFLCLTSTAKLH